MFFEALFWRCEKRLLRSGWSMASGPLEKVELPLADGPVDGVGARFAHQPLDFFEGSGHHTPSRPQKRAKRASPARRPSQRQNDTSKSAPEHLHGIRLRISAKKSRGWCAFRAPTPSTGPSAHRADGPSNYPWRRARGAASQCSDGKQPTKRAASATGGSFVPGEQPAVCLRPRNRGMQPTARSATPREDRRCAGTAPISGRRSKAALELRGQRAARVTRQTQGGNAQFGTPWNCRLFGRLG